MNDANTAARLEARAEIERRCGGQTNGLSSYVLQFSAPADDPWAQRYTEATAALRDLYSHRNTAKIIGALEEMAQQGRLDEAENFLHQIRSWNGESWRQDIDNFSIVVSAAVELAGAVPGGEKDDIRLITRCLRDGRCDYQYGAIPDTVPSAARAKIEKTITEMAAAIRAGDVKRILGER